MNLLPSDILLNVIEFGGETSLGVSDEEIVSRIKRYDPSFNIKEWREEVSIKENLLKEILTHEMESLYKFIKEKGISIRFYMYLSDVSINYGSISISELGRFMSDIGHSVHCMSCDGDSIFNVDVQNAKELQEKLILLWYLKDQGRYDGVIYHSYDKLVHDLQEDNLGDVFHKLEILNIPITLPEYLQCATRRNTALHRVQKMKLYPLYNLLSGRRWHLTKRDGENYKLVMNKISSDTYPQIEKVLSNIFTDWKKHPYTLSSCDVFHIKDDSISLLKDIDLTIHPENPQFLYNFK